MDLVAIVSLSIALGALLPLYVQRALALRRVERELHRVERERDESAAKLRDLSVLVDYIARIPRAPEGDRDDTDPSIKWQLK
jgi:hypothetical protein